MPESRAPELEPKVRAHLLHCWLQGRGTSLRDTAMAIGELRMQSDGGEAADAPPLDDVDEAEGGSGERKEWASTAIRNYWRGLKASGVLIPAEQMPRGRSVGFNLTGRPVEECTLGSMLRPYLAGSSLSARDRRELKTGLRKVLPQLTGVALQGTKTDEMVMVAASRVGPELVPTLVELLEALPSGGSEYARLLRKCMRDAFAQGNAVVMLPALQHRDAWAVWMDEHLPPAVDGRTPPVVERARRACKRLQLELEAMTPEERGGPVPATPRDVDPSLASRAIERVLTVHGDHRQYPLFRKELVRLGEQGLGPYRAGAELGAGLLVLADGKHPTPAFYLRSQELANNAATWPALLATMEEHRVASSMIEFARWVRDFSTLSDKELKQQRDESGRKQFPARRQKIEVELGAETGRIRAFRAFLGAAMNLLGVPGEECTEDRVFGISFEDLTDKIIEAWEARVAANKARAERGIPALGVVRHEASTGLHGLIAAGGMIASMAYDRSRHARGAKGLKMRKGRNGKDLGLDYDAARMQEKTVGETAFLEAYTYSRTTAGNLSNQRGGAQHATHKNKELTFADTPLCDLIPGELALLWKRIQSGRPDPSLPFEVLRAFACSLIATGQMRIEELAHIRQDKQLSPAMRERRGIALRCVDRKDNICAHEVAFNDALQPKWLVDYVFDIAIPALLEKHSARGHAQHPFVFMDANGRPWGDPKESEDGKVRNQRLVQTRKSKLVAMFKDFRLQALRRAGKPILNSHGNNTAHADRGRMANIATNLEGVGAERAGRLMGHLGTQGQGGRASTAERSYSRSNLEANRRTLHAVLLSRDWYRREYGLVTHASGDNGAPARSLPRAAPAEPRSLDDELDAIYARAEQFKLDPAVVNTLVTRAMAKWELTPPAAGALRLAK